jgi:hypothetical protein
LLDGQVVAYKSRAVATHWNTLSHVCVALGLVRLGLVSVTYKGDAYV